MCEREQSFDWDRDLPKGFISSLPGKSVHETGRNPTGWLTIGEHVPYSETKLHGGFSSILLDQDISRSAGIGTGWMGRDLGEFQIIGSSPSLEARSGLSEEVENGTAEFFCQGRKPAGADEYLIEVALPFLWFWDAFLVGNEWRYLTPGGNEKSLIRFETGRDYWKIEVRAEELRSYLHLVNKKLLVQLDLFSLLNEETEDRLELNFHDDWGTYQFLKYDPLGIKGKKTWANLNGYYYIHPRLGKARPRILGWFLEDEEEYPRYLIGQTSDGEEVKFSCDPDVLGNYFGANPEAPHYLTTVFFSRDVLSKYVSNPARYRVSMSRLECLHLWGVDITINENDLVVVYLGDIGEKIPSEERQHWLQYNVLPEGTIDEGRFRRDFLGQWASSPDPVRELKNLIKDINELAIEKLAFKIWREPTQHLETEINALIGPTSSAPTALYGPVLVLTKWLVDSLNARALKKSISEPDPRSASLKNLEQLMEELGLETGSVRHLRSLQDLRSRGGIAHLHNSASQKVYSQLGISGKDAIKDFSIILTHLVDGLSEMREEMQNLQGKR